MFSTSRTAESHADPEKQRTSFDRVKHTKAASQSAAFERRVLEDLSPPKDLRGCQTVQMMMEATL